MTRKGKWIDDSTEEEEINAVDMILFDWVSFLTDGKTNSRSQNINRDFEAGYERLYEDYFAPQPVFPPHVFKRRFRISHAIFNRIAFDLLEHDSFFKRKKNAIGQWGVRGVIKICSALRILAYAAPADLLEDYFRISETLALDSLRHFCRGIRDLYEEEYLRSPTQDDVARLAHENAARGFPGMIGSLDCMKWVWHSCPKAWAGQYKGREKKPTILLEAVASYDLWIWHANFGMPGSNNDINVLQRSALMNAVASGTIPRHEYRVNSRPRTRTYFLVDGIYPEFSFFVKPFSAPTNAKHQEFTRRQESVRKDIERAFGVLQARWRVIANPSRYWYVSSMEDMMYCCIILHNMIVEDNRKEEEENRYDNPRTTANPTAPVEGTRNDDYDDTSEQGGVECERGVRNDDEYDVFTEEWRKTKEEQFEAYTEEWKHMHDDFEHRLLRHDLTEHIWNMKGSSSLY